MNLVLLTWLEPFGHMRFGENENEVTEFEIGE